MEDSIKTKYEVGDSVGVSGHFPFGVKGVVEKIHINRDTGQVLYDVLMPSGVKYSKMEDHDLRS